jgi:hypothetical protein
LSDFDRTAEVLFRKIFRGRTRNASSSFGKTSFPAVSVSLAEFISQYANRQRDAHSTLCVRSPFGSNLIRCAHEAD